MGLTLNVKGNVTIEQYVETQHVGTQYVGKQYTENQTIENRGSDLPAPNDYKNLVTWLRAQREAGHDYLGEAGNNRTLMCKQISPIVGWVVDPNSLGKHYRK